MHYSKEGHKVGCDTIQLCSLLSHKMGVEFVCRADSFMGGCAPHYFTFSKKLFWFFYSIFLNPSIDLYLCGFSLGLYLFFGTGSGINILCGTYYFSYLWPFSSFLRFQVVWSGHYQGRHIRHFRGLCLGASHGED